jgi:PKD repeat protein
MSKQSLAAIAVLVCVSGVSSPYAAGGTSLRWDLALLSSVTGFAVTIDGTRTDYGLSPKASDGTCGCSVGVPLVGGYHTFAVTAYNSTTSATSTYTVGPTASAGGPYNVALGTAISANAAASSNPFGSIAKYAWNWGDGTTSTVTSATTTHTYTNAGSYSVKLTITDASGATATSTTTATVTQTTTTGPTVVIRAASVPVANIHGTWRRTADSTAAGGYALSMPNNGQAKIAPALAAPKNYWETTFSATAGVRYHLWVRMKAQDNSLGNDSIHVQFSDSVNASGSATMRIGTSSSAELVLQAGAGDTAVSGWGWADNGWGTLGASISFATSGVHTLRMQQREDGASVDQIVLSGGTYFTSAPGPRDRDATILPSTAPSTVTVRTASVGTSAIHGAWQRMTDATASGGSALWNTNSGQLKLDAALASPANYWEATFTAQAGVAYHLWVRLRAQSDSLANDSVHVQFSDSVTSSGSSTMRIGTTSSAEIVLQNGSNDNSVHGWGWADNGWGALGANIYFKTTGTHTIRVQQREDGAIVDELLLSPDAFLKGSPGARDYDVVKQ